MAGNRWKPVRAIVAISAASFVLTACATGTSTSPSVAPPASATPEPAASASSSSPATPAATVAPTAMATQTSAATTAPTFRVVESFGEAGWNTQVVDVEFWNDQFVALSSRAEIMTDRHETHVWTSVDGTTWSSDRVDLGEPSARATDLLPLGDGSLAILGASGGPDEMGPRVTAWRSSALDAWEPHDLGMPADQTLQQVAVGPRGYVGLAGDSLWFSEDGLRWQPTQDPADGSFVDVRAGAEGFVAVGITSHYVPFVFASGDGRSWFEANWGPEAAISIGAVGAGDWLAVVGERDFQLRWSADGLDWATTQSLADLAGVTSGIGIDTEVTRTVLTTVGTEVYMTLAWDHCCAQLSGSRGVWWSGDGRDWSALDLGDAVVQAAAAEGDRVVLGGFTDRGGSAALWVSE